jgi:hypothetical protein
LKLFERYCDDYNKKWAGLTNRCRCNPSASVRINVI